MIITDSMTFMEMVRQDAGLPRNTAGSVIKKARSTAVMTLLSTLAILPAGSSASRQISPADTNKVKDALCDSEQSKMQSTAVQIRKTGLMGTIRSEYI